MPKIVSDKPVATWLASMVSVRNANSSDIARPAAIAATTPSHGLPVMAVTA